MLVRFKVAVPRWAGLYQGRRHACVGYWQYWQSRFRWHSRLAATRREIALRRRARRRRTPQAEPGVTRRWAVVRTPRAEPGVTMRWAAVRTPLAALNPAAKRLVLTELFNMRWRRVRVVTHFPCKLLNC